MAAGASRDQRFMSRALRLARRAQGQTSPNPLVGAVVVRAGRVVGQGYHRRAGWPHAEIEALRQAGARARGSTLYVSLEPCNHHGRTPPCCDAILGAGVSRVVAAMRDPNPRTNGRGLSRLRRAGVRVRLGVLEHEARRMNEPFAKAMRTRLPMVIAKVGQSLDGKIATARGQSRWITSAAARRYGHRLRAQTDAILVGINTVLADDPLLNVRGARQRRGRPVKVIVDSHLRLPPRARCLSKASPAPTLIATLRRPTSRNTALTRHGADILTLRSSGDRVPLRALCRALAQRGIQSLLIEGGGEVLASALKERLVDRIVWCIAPVLIGGRTAPGSVGGQGIARLTQAVRLREVSVRRMGTDLCVEADVVYPGR